MRCSCLNLLELFCQNTAAITTGTYFLHLGRPGRRLDWYRKAISKKFQAISKSKTITNQHARDFDIAWRRKHTMKHWTWQLSRLISKKRNPWKPTWAHCRMQLHTFLFFLNMNCFLCFFVPGPHLSEILIRFSIKLRWQQVFKHIRIDLLELQPYGLNVWKTTPFFKLNYNSLNYWRSQREFCFFPVRGPCLAGQKFCCRPYYTRGVSLRLVNLFSCFNFTRNGSVRFWPSLDTR